MRYALSALFLLGALLYPEGRLPLLLLAAFPLLRPTSCPLRR